MLTQPALFGSLSKSRRLRRDHFTMRQENRSAAEIASRRLPGGRAQRGNPRSCLPRPPALSPSENTHFTIPRLSAPLTSPCSMRIGEPLQGSILATQGTGGYHPRLFKENPAGVQLPMASPLSPLTALCSPQRGTGNGEPGTSSRFSPPSAALHTTGNRERGTRNPSLHRPPLRQTQRETGNGEPGTPLSTDQRSARHNGEPGTGNKEHPSLHRPPPTAHLSPLTSHLSPLTSHFSPLTSHLSLLTSHLSPLHLPPYGAFTRATSFSITLSTVTPSASAR